MSNWMSTGIVYETRRTIWERCAEDLMDDGGIGHHQWVDMDSGSMLLLAASGSWKTGGRFALFWLNPLTGTVVDITGALTRLVGSTGYPQGHPSAWQDVKNRLIAVVEHNIVGRVTPDVHATA